MYGPLENVKKAHVSLDIALETFSSTFKIKMLFRNIHLLGVPVQVLVGFFFLSRHPL